MSKPGSRPTQGGSSLHVVNRRTFLAGAATLAAASSLPAPAIAQATKVRYTLSWLPTGQYAFAYLARSLGFWKKRGLDVEVSRGFGSMAAIQAVSTDKFEMGGAATGALILSVMRGMDLKVVGTQGYDSFMGILAPEKGPIKEPKDLVGKKMGVTAAGGDTPFIEAYLKLAGVDPAKVEIVSLDSQIIERSVMNGRVDCMVAFGMSSIPNFLTQDFPVRLLKVSDYGLQFYWVNSFVKADYFKKNPEVVGHVQAGLMEGMKWMMLNPKEAVDRHLKEHEEIAVSAKGRLFTELGVGMISVCNTAEETVKNGLGYTDIAKMDKQGALVKQYTGKPEDPAVPPATSYTVNLPGGAVTLTADEWSQVRTNAASYAKLLGV